MFDAGKGNAAEPRTENLAVVAAAVVAAVVAIDAVNPLALTALRLQLATAGTPINGVAQAPLVLARGVGVGVVIIIGIVVIVVIVVGC
jgi:hypothetical protein